MLNNIYIVPIMFYEDANTDKLRILSDNKDKTGIYLWTHKESGKIYIGSAFDLSDRLKRYFSLSELKRMDNYICRAIILHNHSSFTLGILEYIDISNLSKKDARELILSREQYFIDKIFSEVEPNTYNILKEAGSSLGFKHSSESLAKMSEAMTDEKKAKLSEINKGKNNPMFGKTHEVETLTKMSFSKIGNKNPNKKVFVYLFNSETKETILHKTFDSGIEAAKYLNCANYTISKYIDKDKLYKNQWIISSFEK